MTHKPNYKKLPPHEILTQNPDHHWLEKQYPGFLHALFMQGIHAGVFLMHKHFPFGFKAGYCINSCTQSGEETMDWFWDVRELERVRRIFLARARRSMGFFNTYYRWWEIRYRRMLAAYRRAEGWDFHPMTDRQLYDAYEQLYWANVNQGAAGYLADCFLTVGEQDWLSDFIRSRIGPANDLDHIVTTLTAPSIPTYANEEEIALKKIVREVHGTFRTLAAFQRYVRRHRSLHKRLVMHAAQYYWVENSYFSKVLTANSFINKLYLLQKKRGDGTTVSAFRHNRQAKAQFLRQLNDPWLERVIRMSELMTHVQDCRKMGVIRFCHFLHIIFGHMAARTGLDLKDFHNIIEPELLGIFLERRIDRAMLRGRRRKNFAYGTPSGYVVYGASEMERYVNEKQFHPDLGARNSIKGVSAYRGKATGVARLIRNAHQDHTFHAGDILVTNNTTPEFVPIMKRASAIVTDQGGITCHAAIISRELKKPCVIGTKIATKVLKDGDLVEVDAEKGIVRKL